MNNSNENNNGNSGAKYTIIGVVMVVVFFLIGLFVFSLPTLMGMGTAPGQNTVIMNKKYDTITVNTHTESVDISIRNIKTVYNIDGSLEYDVTFFIREYNTVFNCVISAENADKLDENAIYKGELQFGYLEEFYADMNIGALNSIGAKLKSNSTYKDAIGVNFYFSEYVTSGFKTIEDLENTWTTLVGSKELNELNEKANTSDVSEDTQN